jgi:HSP20 family protein
MDMNQELAPWFSQRMPSLGSFDDIFSFNTSNSVDIFEDEKNIYIEAPLPGMHPKDIEVTFDKGVLWIKARSQEGDGKEQSGKKYYSKSSRSYSYRITVPGDVDLKKEPAASCKDGIMKITFAKAEESMPKRIAIQAE